MQTVILRHPVWRLLATAIVIKEYHRNGRYVGADLQFSDGHIITLTASQIEIALDLMGKGN